jgi:hypothetical protein
MKFLLALLLSVASCGAVPPACRAVWSDMNLPYVTRLYDINRATNNSGLVTGFPDLSGNGGFAFPYVSSAHEGTYLAGSLNGYPAVLADGTNTCYWLTNTTIANVLSAGGSNGSFAAVLVFTNLHVGQIACSYSSSASSLYEIVVDDTSTKIDFDTGNNTTARLSATGQTWTNYIVLCASRNGANGWMLTNGVQIAISSTLSGVSGTTTNEMALFSGTFGGLNTTGRQYFVKGLFSTNSWTQQQGTNITRYLAMPYNIKVQ